MIGNLIRLGEVGASNVSQDQHVNQALRLKDWSLSEGFIVKSNCLLICAIISDFNVI